MSPDKEPTLRDIQAATAYDQPGAFPHGAAYFCNLVTNGPSRIREEIHKLGIKLYKQKGLHILNTVFKEISCNLPETLVDAEIRRRLEKLGILKEPDSPPKPQQFQIGPNGVVPIPNSPQAAPPPPPSLVPTKGPKPMPLGPIKRRKK
jgi:hypothetical protein